MEPENQIHESIIDDSDSIRFDAEERKYLGLHPHAVETRSPTKHNRLGFTSVMCVIINRVVGTGIFRTPTTLMRGTQSVGVTLLFWFGGAATAIAGTFVFIELGLNIPRYVIDGSKEAIPKNGGELNYLKYLLKKPKFFAVCIFGVVYIVLGNAAGNAIYFGELALEAAGIKGSHNSARGIAVAVTTFACLIHGIWRRGGIILNNIFAIIKIAILILIIVIGFIALGGHFERDGSTQNFASQNLKPSNAFTAAPTVTYGYVESFLSVIFAYGGYNQANYVLSEIDHPRKTFKRAAPAAVGMLCIIYMLVNISYMIVVRREDQINSGDDVSLQFFKNTLGEDIGARVLAGFMAISSLGNIIVTTFTLARVKQEIAKEGIIPYPKFFAENSSLIGYLAKRRGALSSFSEPTPNGALLLHWVFTVLLIFATWFQDDVTDSYAIIVSIYSYTVDAFIFFVLASGLLYLRLYTPSSKTPWRRKSTFSHPLSILSAAILALATAFPLIVSWIPPSSSSSNSAIDKEVEEALIPSYPWYSTPVISWSLLGFAVVYWACFRYVLPRFGNRKGKELIAERRPFLRAEHGYYIQWHEVVDFHWHIK